MTKPSLRELFSEAVDFIKKITSFGIDVLSSIFEKVYNGPTENVQQYQQIIDYYADRFITDQALEQKNYDLASSVLKRLKHTNVEGFNFAVLNEVDAHSIINEAHAKAQDLYPFLEKVHPKERPATVSYVGLSLQRDN